MLFVSAMHDQANIKYVDVLAYNPIIRYLMKLISMDFEFLGGNLW
jgi:hypothetical protein